MKLFKRVLVEMLVISSVVVCSLTFINKDKEETPLLTTVTQSVEQVAKEQEKMDVAIDIKKEILDEKLTKANAMITKTSEDLELVLVTLDGSINTTHSRKDADDFVFFNNANLNVKLDFTCKIGISTNDIKFEVLNDGGVGIRYNKDDIKILSTEIKNTTYSEHTDIFAKKFSKSELISIIESNTDKIKSAIGDSNKYINKAEKTLQSYYYDMAKTCGVYSVCFNGGKTIIANKTYNFFDCTNVKYGHGNVELKQENVKYIILHGTGNVNVSAEKHIKWLNDDTATDQNACHFYVDPTGIYQALNTNIVSWNAKEYNNKSVSIEICTYSDNTKQMQSIHNAKTVVDILKKKYPQAKVVTHKLVSDYGKKCPDFVYGDKAIMTEDEFLKYFEN